MTVMFREGPFQCSPSYHFYILSIVPKNRTINDVYARHAKGISILIWIPLSLIPVVLPAILTHPGGPYSATSSHFSGSCGQR